jgi:hypothetical protein
VVVVAIHKADVARTVGVAVTHGRPLGTARAFVLSGTQPAWQAAAAPAVTGNSLVIPMPAMSIAVIELGP